MPEFSLSPYWFHSGIISEILKIYHVIFILILAVPLWLEYAQFSIGGMGEEGGIDRVRNVFERALAATGLHVTEGATLWEAYREFENAILAGLQVI